MVAFGDTIKIVAGGNASLRTRNRLREHGNTFEVVHPQMFCEALKCEAICVTVGNDTDVWTGWLPVNEILVNGL
jgi:hypothetical protein